MFNSKLLVHSEENHGKPWKIQISAQQLIGNHEDAMLPNASARRPATALWSRLRSLLERGFPNVVHLWGLLENHGGKWENENEEKLTANRMISEYTIYILYIYIYLGIVGIFLVSQPRKKNGTNAEMVRFQDKVAGCLCLGVTSGLFTRSPFLTSMHFTWA